MYIIITQSRHLWQVQYKLIKLNRQMGNACCSAETSHSSYDPNLKKIIEYDPSVSTRSTINFPVGKIPIKNNVVEQLNNQAGNFSAKNLLSIPSGSPSNPRALNKDGMVYHGEWLNGIPHGKGQLYYSNGSYYVGYFSKGNADGQGRFVSPDGWMYEGELQNQQAQGKGILYHKFLKYKYEGSWSGDLPNGFGRQQWLSKNIAYEGNFLNGKKHGEGKYSSAEFQYEGHFNENYFDSYGSLSYKNGEKYEGNFENGKKNGKGIYTWPDGSHYDGYFKNDLKHGQGRYKEKDGSYWEGQWSNGKREGYGYLKIGNKNYFAQWNNGNVFQTVSKSRISGMASKLSIETFK